MKSCISMIVPRWIPLRMKNVSGISCSENQNTQFMFNNFFQKSCRLWDNVEKYCRAGQAIDDNMAHAHCMLDTSVYKHTLRIRNTLWFFTAKMVARKRLNARLVLICAYFDICYKCQYNFTCLNVSDFFSTLSKFPPCSCYGNTHYFFFLSCQLLLGSWWSRQYRLQRLYGRACPSMKRIATNRRHLEQEGYMMLLAIPLDHYMNILICIWPISSYIYGTNSFHIVQFFNASYQVTQRKPAVWWYL
jgi:hypothetical protein